MTPEQVEAVKGGSAVAIIVAYLANISAPTWAAILAGVYSIMLIGEKLYQWFKRKP